MRVYTCCSLGNIFTKFYLEATMKTWHMAQTAFKFCQSFASIAETI
jgi:hypothetical protein